MKGTTKTILILLAVLVVLCGVYAIVTSGRGGEKEEESLTISNISDAQYVRIQRPGETLEFTNSGEHWVYEADPEFPLSDAAVTEIANAALGLTALREMDRGDLLSSYGLESDFTTLTIIDSENHAFNLEIGNSTGDGRYYAHIPNTEKIYVISDQLPDAVSGSLYDMMVKEKFGSFLPEDVTSVTVTKDGEVTAYDPPGEEMTSAAANLRFATCVNYKADSQELAEAGLDDTAAEITVNWGESDTNTMLVGKSDGEGFYYACIKGSKGLYKIAASMVEPFLAG